MQKSKSVLLVTLDCVRPDHLGFNGYLGVDTPNFDRIAREGAVFDEAVAQAPNTWVSHAAIFTGTYPFNNGIRTHFSKFNENVITFAEVLSTHGYATAAFPAHSLVGEAKGFSKGFDLFDLNLDDLTLASAAAENRYYRDWGDMWSKAKKWILAQDKPFFVWLHYMGTHWVPTEKLELPEEYRRKYSAYGQYFDGKISWADIECIGEIYTFLRDANLLDDTILSIFSDHGDDLPANDPPYVWGGHNQNLFDNVMKIAWVMRAHGLIPNNTRVTQQVRSIDMMPTILDLIDLPIPASIDGKSLVPYFGNLDGTNVGTQYAYIENAPRKWVAVRTKEWKLILTSNPPTEPDIAEQPRLTSLSVLKEAYRAGANVIRENKDSLNTILLFPMRVISKLSRLLGRENQSASPIPHQRPNPEEFDRQILQHGYIFGLFDLKNDPDEQHDVSDAYPEVVQDLNNHLYDLLRAKRSSQAIELSTDEREQVEKRMQDLGYM